MKLQLLPSTIENGIVSKKQHLSCFVIDDILAVDAGSLAMSSNIEQKKQIRDVVLTHAHIDHIAGLPLFIDDLFSSIKKPVEVYAAEEVIQVLKDDIFNWSVYPNFAELENESGPVLRYRPFQEDEEFQIEHLMIKPIGVNHKVPAVGFMISDLGSRIAITGDTSEMSEFWRVVNREKKISALLVECAFPDRLLALAETSHHMTPSRLKAELEKFSNKECPIYVINIKPMHYDEVRSELDDLGIENLNILEVGKAYQF